MGRTNSVVMGASELRRGISCPREIAPQPNTSAGYKSAAVSDLRRNYVHAGRLYTMRSAGRGLLRQFGW